MATAQFLRGKPVMENYDAGGSQVNAGDVVIVGGLPCVAHEDIPAFTGAHTLDALAVCGGIYLMTSDATYADGTFVLYDSALKEVTTVRSATTYPFGWIVGGPSDALSDGGPTGSAACSVLHFPVSGALGALPSSIVTTFGAAAAGSVGGAFREEGNIYCNAGAPIAGNGADTTDDILGGFQLPANVFDKLGRQINVIAQGLTGATTNNKRFKIFVNPTMAGQTVNADGSISGGTVTAGTPVCDSGAWVNGTTPNNAVGWLGQATITKYGANGSNTQKGQATAILGATHGGIQASQSLTLPENAVINIVVTGSSYTTGAASDVKLEQLTITGSN